MQSLFDLHRRGEPMGGLLGGYTPSNEIVDRATMLPIGQYEDGSLEFATPGAAQPFVEWGRGRFDQGSNNDFLTGMPQLQGLLSAAYDPLGTAKSFASDAYDLLLRPGVEGAVRSYEQGRQLPRADDSGYYAGTPRAEPLDAFNAASVGPVSGVVGRAAGTIPRGALGSGGSETLTKLAEQPTATRAYHWSPNASDIGPDSKFYPFSHFGSRKAAEDRFNVMHGEQPAGGTMPVDLDIRNPLRIGDLGDHTPVRIAAAVDYAMDPKSLDSWGASPLVREVAHSDPIQAARLVDDAIKAKGYDGIVYRNHSEDKGSDSFIATRPGTVRSAITGELLFAHPTESSLPSLMTNGMEEYQLANADPAYDANALVAERWRDKPRIQGEPSSYGFGYIEPPAVFQQERIDPPSMWFKPQPLPPPPLFR